MSQDKPEGDEPKSERFNMFMSPSEMKEIDEWAWRNLIRSKSEAVRRLVQIGLVFDENADDIAWTSQPWTKGTVQKQSLPLKP